MEIRHLRHFTAVAATLNFRVAAERLHLTQPALTRSIAALESELGVRLFHRDKRHVALTADGAALLDRARGLLAGVDEFAFAAHALGTSSQQFLRVGVYGDGLAELTDMVLRTFRELYPDTRLQIRDADFAHGIRPLLSGDFHVAMLRAPAKLPELRIVPIFREPLDLLLPRGHRLAGAEPVDVRQLFGEPWVTLPPTIPGAWVAHWLRIEERGDSSAIVGSYARSEFEFQASVAYERHVGLLPRSAYRLRPHPGVVAVPAIGLEPSTAAVAFPAVGYEPAAAALADVATEVARTHLHLVREATLP